jgi:HAD superfamily hydrolase (TIGR01662 family)
MFSSEDRYVPGWQRELREKLSVKRQIFGDNEFLPCLWCGVRLPFEKATLDHLITQSVGGPTTTDNIGMACANCNRKRRDRRIDVWEESKWLAFKREHLTRTQANQEKRMARHPLEVVMVIGAPGSGKGTVSGDFIDKGYVHLNRDKEGGQVISLLPKMTQHLSNGKRVVLDNLFIKAADRAPFIQAAQAAGIPIRCVWLQTSIEEAQINVLNRMWDRYNDIFFSNDDIKAHPDAKKDPNIFPIAVLFKYRKEFEKPSLGEGFVAIEKVPFIRRPWPGKNKAILLDYDGTLRTCKSGAIFPCTPDDVEVLPRRAEVLKGYVSQGYKLYGVSNQSGIGKGDLTRQQADACFKRTNELLGLDIPFFYSPSRVPPITTYCRKPQSGIGVYLIRRYDLKPSDCIMVGDMGTDKSFAERLGFQFRVADEFFAA